MKKVCFILTFMSILFSCSDKSQGKLYLVDYVDRLVRQYPNYSSNDIANKALQDSIRMHAESFVGNHPKDIEGLEFTFSDLVEKEGEYGALFIAHCYSDINDESGARKYITSDVVVSVFGVVDKATAAKLDKNRKYYIGGVLEEWDSEQYTSKTYMSDEICFGTYFLRDIKIETIKQK